MRHTASCVFNHVDPDVVTNLGFLPQDMLGKSIFDFYHPEDMPFLKEVYESGKYTKFAGYSRLTFSDSDAHVPCNWIGISEQTVQICRPEWQLCSHRDGVVLLCKSLV